MSYHYVTSDKIDDVPYKIPGISQCNQIYLPNNVDNVDVMKNTIVIEQEEDL